MKNAATDKTNDLDKLIMDGMGGSGGDKNSSSDKSKSKAPRSPLVLGIVFMLLVGALTVFLISKYMFGPSKTAVKTPIKDITKVSASEGCTPTETKTLTMTPQGFTPDAGVINLSVNDPSSYCLGLTIINNFGSKQSVFFPSIILSNNPININLESGANVTTTIKFDAYAAGQTTQTHYMLGGIYHPTGFENLKGKIVLTKNTVTSGPDLTGSISVVKTNNGLYTLGGTISNVGNQSIFDTIATDIYVDPPDQPPNSTTPSMNRYTHQSLNPGLVPSDSFSFGFADQTLTPGVHKLYIWIDKNNTISESNENNNIIEISYTAQ